MTIELGGKEYQLKLTNKKILRLEERLEAGPVKIIQQLIEFRISTLVDAVFLALEGQHKLQRHDVERLLLEKKDAFPKFTDWASFYSDLVNAFVAEFQLLKVLPMTDEGEQKNADPASGTGQPN